MNAYAILVGMLVMSSCCTALETGPLINALRIDNTKFQTASTVHGRHKRTGGLVGNILKFVGDTIGGIGSSVHRPDLSRPYDYEPFVYNTPTVPRPVYPIYGSRFVTEYNPGWVPINGPGYGHGYGPGYGPGYSGYGPGYPAYGPGYQGYGPGNGQGTGAGFGQGFGHGFGPSYNPGNALGNNPGGSIGPTVAPGYGRNINPTRAVCRYDPQVDDDSAQC